MSRLSDACKWRQLADNEGREDTENSPSTRPFPDYDERFGLWIEL